MHDIQPRPPLNDAAEACLQGWRRLWTHANLARQQPSASARQPGAASGPITTPMASQSSQEGCR